MANIVKGICVFLGIVIGNLFLNGAGVSSGAFATPPELSKLMVITLTWWGAMNIFLKIAAFMTKNKTQ